MRLLPVSCLLALLAPAALAGTGLTVNSLLDLPDADVKDGVCDADPETPGQQITLRAAVMFANTVAGADTITLPAGTYKLTLQGHDEEGSATGDLDVNGDLTITGEGATTTIVDGKKAKDRVFDVVEGVSVTFEGFTIQRGAAPTKDIDDQRGGGIRNAGDLTLRAMVLTKCKTGDADAGGLSHGTGTLVVEDSVISKNRSKDDGGGVDVQSGGATFTRVSLVKNKAGGNGGGLECSPADVAFENCTFSGNTSGAGGGALSIKNGSTVALVNCTLRKNASKVGSGLFEDPGFPSSIELGNCIVANKAATNFSGVSLTSLGGNLDSGSTCAFAAAGDLSDTDPRLSKLLAVEGQLPVHPLKPDSPCIDTADDAQCPATDQLGQAHVDVPDVGTSVCDRGAAEFQPEP